ncbi:rho/rac/cdc gtpase-activating protein [Anaeramoeba flamelloides]|uniref:Rho/rac/cdc gtpase-activating protein n=1 Tax=Anaeramoeba flamelloides TaxID=1746091 RepID=A0ABQ8XRZ8_9EUKA|nr:rho/rac/cdc gtpase-activating protein [Anaeramoeba flamelloides]
MLKTGGETPQVLVELTNELQKKGLLEVGIFRVPGSVSQVNKMRHEIDLNGNFDFSSCNDPNALSGLLKLFLRELPNPLFTFDLFLQWETVSEIHLIRELVCELPKIHRSVLKTFVEFFVKVNEKSKINKMNSNNLAKVIGPNLSRSRVNYVGYGAVKAFEKMILNYEEIFCKPIEKLKKNETSFVSGKLEMGAISRKNKSNNNNNYNQNNFVLDFEKLSQLREEIKLSENKSNKKNSNPNDSPEITRNIPNIRIAGTSYNLRRKKTVREIVISQDIDEIEKDQIEKDQIEKDKNEKDKSEKDETKKDKIEKSETKKDKINDIILKKSNSKHDTNTISVSIPSTSTDSDSDSKSHVNNKSKLKKYSNSSLSDKSNLIVSNCDISGDLITTSESEK